MGLFGRKRVSGISAYELDRARLRNKLRTAFPRGSSGDTKMAALNTALAVALDADANTSYEQQVVQVDEFEMIISTMAENGLITEDEASKLRSIAQKDLHD